MFQSKDVFVIVSFDETNEVDFVPVNWIADGTRVSEIGRLIKSRSLLEFYWPPNEKCCITVKSTSCKR